MPRKNSVLDSDTVKRLEKMGIRIKKARLRRNISVKSMSEKTCISETTIYAIERGASGVSLGAYAAVLEVLQLDKDFESIALDDECKQQMREQILSRRERASKKKRNKVKF